MAMNTKPISKKRKILRKIYGALSLSTALFVFQACYGPQQDLGADFYIQGVVKSKSTNQPISGIKVSVANQPQYEYTDSTGCFKIYASYASEYKIVFEDIDSTENGNYRSLDTILDIVNDTVYLNISLDAANGN
jgi:putative lipoprotein (rSAM/lipoprotein system)